MFSQAKCEQVFLSLYFKNNLQFSFFLAETSSSTLYTEYHFDLSKADSFLDGDKLLNPIFYTSITQLRERIASLKDNDYGKVFAYEVNKANVQNWLMRVNKNLELFCFAEEVFTHIKSAAEAAFIYVPYPRINQYSQYR